MSRDSWLGGKCDNILTLSDYFILPHLWEVYVKLSKEWQGVSAWGKSVTLSWLCQTFPHFTPLRSVKLRRKKESRDLMASAGHLCVSAKKRIIYEHMLQALLTLYCRTRHSSVASYLRYVQAQCLNQCPILKRGSCPSTHREIPQVTQITRSLLRGTTCCLICRVGLKNIFLSQMVFVWICLTEREGVDSLILPFLLADGFKLYQIVG